MDWENHGETGSLQGQTESQICLNFSSFKLIVFQVCTEDQTRRSDFRVWPPPCERCWEVQPSQLNSNFDSVSLIYFQKFPRKIPSIIPFSQFCIWPSGESDKNLNLFLKEKPFERKTSLSSWDVCQKVMIKFYPVLSLEQQIISLFQKIF